jgi:hypothetical protein
MALEQEQAAAARAILSLAKSGQIELAYPSFVLCEPFETIIRARRDCNILEKSLVERLSHLERSAPYKTAVLDADPAVTLWKSAYISQMRLLHTIFGQLLSVGRCIYVSASDFGDAIMYQEGLEFSPQDSIIYAAMIADLKKQSAQKMKCFLSRDHKAFGRENDRSIKDELGKHNCRYIGSFIQGLDFVKSTINSSGYLDDTK